MTAGNLSHRVAESVPIEPCNARAFGSAATQAPFTEGALTDAPGQSHGRSMRDTDWMGHTFMVSIDSNQWCGREA